MFCKFRQTALALCLVATVWFPGQAVAQSDEGRYESMLLRLSEIVGALHFLTTLCQPEDAKGAWRAQMEALLEAESAFPQRQRLMTIRFNRGFSSFSQVYRSCTQSARIALRDYRNEGSALTQELIALNAPS